VVGLRARRGKCWDKCWDKIADVVDIFFESHVRLRRELQLKLVDVKHALDRGDIETAKQIVRELLVFLDM
jgi:hypothetical protein